MIVFLICSFLVILLFIAVCSIDFTSCKKDFSSNMLKKPELLEHIEKLDYDTYAVVMEEIRKNPDIKHVDH